MSTTVALVRLLAGGGSCSGEAIARTLGVSGSAVRALVAELRERGVAVDALPEEAYRLAGPFELLDKAMILAELDAAARACLSELRVLDEVDSTNSDLTRRARELPRHGAAACLAELQRTGRGRRGRHWESPLGNLCLSVSWAFPLPARRLAGLSLAMGVAAAEALVALGASGVALKWPNDLLCDGAKLGGILVEIGDAQTERCRAVVGIGLNVSMSTERGAGIDQPWTDLRSVLGCDGVLRNRASGRLLRHVLVALARFEADGFAAFADDWNRFDATRRKSVVVHGRHARLCGEARGVDADGALLVAVDGRVERVVSADLSLTVVP